MLYYTILLHSTFILFLFLSSYFLPNFNFPSFLPYSLSCSSSPISYLTFTPFPSLPFPSNLFFSEFSIILFSPPTVSFSPLPLHFLLPYPLLISHSLLLASLLFPTYFYDTSVYVSNASI